MDLRDRRQKLEMSIDQICRLLGFRAQDWRDWEKGRKMAAKTENEINQKLNSLEHKWRGSNDR